MHPQRFLHVVVDPEYRIRGEYPRVRFFSFQTYDYPGVQVSSRMW